MDGVSVYIDSEYGGATDYWGATVNGLLERTYTLKLTKSGYKDWTKQVSITAGNTTTVYAYLEPEAGQTPTPTLIPTFTPTSTPTPTPTPFGSWSDGFESYETGSFPSTNWVPDANALDTANNYVDATKAFSGSKSLRLYGQVGGCWGALTYRPINVKPPYYVEVKVNNGSENLSGCHPLRAALAIYEGTSWTNRGRSLVVFIGDGQIRTSWDGGGTSDMSGPEGNRLVLGEYSPGIWYTVRVKYEILDASTVRLTYWINGVYKGEHDFTTSSVEASFTNLSLTAWEGTAWFDDVKVWAAEPPAENTFTGSVALPSQVSTDPKVIGTNITLALAFILLFYFAATLFNSTIKANYEIIRGWVSRASGLFKLLIGSVSRKTSRRKNIRARGYLRILLSVLLCALIYCYLDSYFTYNLTGLALFLSLALTIGIVTNCYQGGQSLFGRTFYDIRSRFSIYPIAILIAIAFVVFSRAINFHPGLIYGFVGGYVIFLGSMKADTADERGEVRKAAIVVLCGALLITSVALLAFYLRTFIPRSSEGEMNFWISLADGILAGVFVGGIQGLFFSLVPLTFLDGAKITAWKWWVWPLVMAPLAFIFWHIMINKAETFSNIAGNMGARMMWGIVAFFLLLSVVTWLYFRWRYKTTPVEAKVKQPTIPAGKHTTYCPTCHEAVPEGAHFCSKCGAPLSQSAE
jgi:hypothetical protein